MRFNASESFSLIFSSLSEFFKNIINLLDSIIIIGDSTSILDLNIAIAVFSIIFVAVFNVVRAGAVNSGDSVAASARAKASDEKYESRQRQNRLYNQAVSEQRKR